MCQCDYGCLAYGECCSDFEARCTTSEAPTSTSPRKHLSSVHSQTHCVSCAACVRYRKLLQRTLWGKLQARPAVYMRRWLREVQAVLSWLQVPLRCRWWASPNTFSMADYHHTSISPYHHRCDTRYGHSLVPAWATVTGGRHHVTQQTCRVACMSSSMHCMQSSARIHWVTCDVIFCFDNYHSRNQWSIRCNSTSDG